jgi:hypothetical protein
MEAQDSNDNLMFVIAFLRDKDLCHVYSEALHTPPPSQNAISIYQWNGQNQVASAVVIAAARAIVQSQAFTS